MSITHEQARKLIQLNMDQALRGQEPAVLSAHLRECGECTLYARQVMEAVNTLSPMLKRQWRLDPIPLSIATLTEKAARKKPRAILTMRKAVISLFCLALFVSTWQWVSSGAFRSKQDPLAILPVPTPSRLNAQSTRTQFTLQDCIQLSYTVQEGDSLAGIARDFSVPEALIIQLNHIDAAGLRPGLKLEIPTCDFTPTGTFRAATYTGTHTPVSERSTSTPGG